jgi:hypothetical protein
VRLSRNVCAYPVRWQAHLVDDVDHPYAGHHLGNESWSTHVRCVANYACGLWSRTHRPREIKCISLRTHVWRRDICVVDANAAVVAHPYDELDAVLHNMG